MDLNRRNFLILAATLAAGRAAMAAPSLVIHYHRYEGSEWDCYVEHGVARWVAAAKTLSTVKLTSAQQAALRKAIQANGFFSLPEKLYHSKVDDRDTLTVTMDGKKHEVSANQAGGDRTKPFYAVLTALEKVAPEPMKAIRKATGPR